MKNCQFCGAEIQDHQVICPACFRYTIPELDPKNMRVYAADGREFGPHLSKEQQGIRNPAFEKAFRQAKIPPQKDKYCRNCGEKLPADARFCGMCGTACPPVPQQSGNTGNVGSGSHTVYRIPELDQTRQTEKDSGKKKLFVLIAVLSAVVLLLAGILTGILLGGKSNVRTDRDDDEDEVRDRDDREDGEDDKDGDSSGSLLARTNTYKLVETTGAYQTDGMENNITYTYNEAGQLICYEKMNNQGLYGFDQKLTCTYTYDEAGQLSTVDMMLDDQTASLTYAYENGVPVSCSGIVDGIYGEFLYTTDQNGRITSVSLFSEDVNLTDCITAAYDEHGCLTETVYQMDGEEGNIIHRFNCDGKQTAAESHSSWFFSATEYDYDGDGHLIATRQSVNGELISDIQYVYSHGRKPVLEAMVVNADDTSVEMPFEWNGSTGISTPDPELTGGDVGTVTVTVDDDGDILSLRIESEDYVMETYTTYVTLELPEGQKPSDPNDPIYLHNLFAAMMG